MASEIRQLIAIAVRQSAAIASLVVRAEGVCGGSRDVQPSEDAVLAAMANLSGHNSGHGGEIPKIPSRCQGPKCLKRKGETGAPGEIRTPDLLLRRQSLYPAEL